MGNGGRHFNGKLQQHNTQLRGVAFGQGEWVDKMKDLTGQIDIAFRPVVSEFRGFQKVELHLMDWRHSQSVPKPHVELTESALPMGHKR
jgi:single-stranded-DNA-specific exonuclease